MKPTSALWPWKRPAREGCCRSVKLQTKSDAFILKISDGSQQALLPNVSVQPLEDKEDSGFALFFHSFFDALTKRVAALFPWAAAFQ